MVQLLTLSTLLGLAAAQPATLAITNDRITFCGEFGPTRSKNVLLPGDLFFLAFDIENLKPDNEGKLNYAIGMEVSDAAGKPIYVQRPVDNVAILPLGGTTLPARVFCDLSTRQPGGLYSCRVTVTDRVAKVTKTLDKKFEVSAPAFGIVYVYTSVDEDGLIPMPLVGVVGQPLFVRLQAVGFARDASKQPNVIFEARILDQNSKAIGDRPLTKGFNKGVPESADRLLWGIPVPLNRSGSFTIEIKADCKISGQTAKVTIPIRVLAPNN
jgi:hypothetical protein